ncbi:DUF6911 family protein [Wohlfahrtiimonas populi]|uniref:DUF6911 family protein n=1 Tax=Wohlfahrtiimonas populi TaxID=1940240 RepID=UPI00098D5AE7|nr:hypothetical protein [Wohlfahrtiimonas populi]
MTNYTLVDMCPRKAIHTHNVKWEQIEILLKAIHNSKWGSISLEVEDINAVDLGPTDLNLKIENGWYLITLMEVTENDEEVRSYYKPDPNYKMVEILGYEWSSTQLIRDFDLVLQIFKEFYETGDVSKDILDFD